MKFIASAINKLDSYLPVQRRIYPSYRLAALAEENKAVSPLDPGHETATVSHGSFDELPSPTCTITPVDPQDIFYDAIDQAEHAYLTNEEATKYLKRF
jgi:hypothetical protein